MATREPVQPELDRQPGHQRDNENREHQPAPAARGDPKPKRRHRSTHQSEHGEAQRAVPEGAARVRHTREQHREHGAEEVLLLPDRRPRRTYGTSATSTKNTPRAQLIPWGLSANTCDTKLMALPRSGGCFATSLALAVAMISLPIRRAAALRPAAPSPTHGDDTHEPSHARICRATLDSGDAIGTEPRSARRCSRSAPAGPTTSPPGTIDGATRRALLPQRTRAPAANDCVPRTSPRAKTGRALTVAEVCPAACSLPSIGCPPRMSVRPARSCPGAR